MLNYRAPLKDMEFLIEDVFAAENIWAKLKAFKDTDYTFCKDLFAGAAKFAENELAPLRESADHEGVSFNNGVVSTPKGFKKAYKGFIDNGWGSVVGDPNYGGLGLSNVVNAVASEIFTTANTAFGLYSGLTAGAGIAMEAHAHDDLKTTYLPKMYSGEWSACMCLTEPHAGTDLGIIRTKAVPQADGSYLISGNKIFITAGEHDLTDNILYLVLAKLPNAPAGSRGISLFLVSKFDLNSDDSLGKRNGVQCVSIEHKMGIHGSATCSLQFDNAKAYLIGEENKGLAGMFTMMNHERLMVGVQGVASAENGYQQSLAYALDRRQGRSAKNMSQNNKTDANSADLIISHPDVRRMLLVQKSFVEAARAFVIYVALKMDIAEAGEGAEQKHADNLVSLLTPVVKAFLTDKGFDCTVIAQQVFGGHGYIRETGIEQTVRDARIAQIYEGTNGVQALDLLYRKILLNNAEWLNLFIDEIKEFLKSEAANKDLESHCKALHEALVLLKDTTDWVMQQAMQDPDEVGAASNDYLHLLGHIALAWMWAMNAAAALRTKNHDKAFCDSKLMVADFYIERVLPQIYALSSAIKSSSKVLMSLPAESF